MQLHELIYQISLKIFPVKCVILHL